MNPSEHQLNRLLECAQKACPPVPPPSPWLETQVLAAVRAETFPLSRVIDGWFLVRVLAGAALVMSICVGLPFIQVKTPISKLSSWRIRHKWKTCREQI